jgi:hypothetical protein
MYVAVISHGYVVAFAFIIGGIAFFSLQRHFRKYYFEIVKNGDPDPASDDDDDIVRLPPA